MSTLTALISTHGFITGDFDTTDQFGMASAFQKVYFVDGRPEVSSTNTGYHKLDFINTRLVSSAATISQGEVITQAVTSAQGVVDETYTWVAGSETWQLIYRTSTQAFTTTQVCTTANTSVSFTPQDVVDPPHWLAWELTDGVFPDGGSNLIGLCFGRLFLNSMLNPHQWFCTRAGNPLDLLMAQDDVGTPMSSQNSKAGLVGDQITAFIPYKDHYLVFGCLNEVWVLRSDPAAGGILTNVSKQTGIFSSTSYCWDDKNTLYFMGTDGIYALTAEAIINAQPPLNLTKENVPKLVTSMGLNRRTDRVTMAFDKDRYGLLISCFQRDGEWSTQFWLDLRQRVDEDGNLRVGVFPEAYQSDHIPTSCFFFNSRKKDERGLLVGCADGYIRKFDEDTKNDDGSTINSWATVGPVIDISEPRSSIKMNDLSLAMSNGTDGVDVNIYSGETPEQVTNTILVASDAIYSVAFSGDNLLPSIRTKVRGGSIAIKLANATISQSWGVEKITANIEKSGRI